MKRNFAKTTALLLVLMLFGMMLAGCQSSQGGSQDEQGSQSTQSEEKDSSDTSENKLSVITSNFPPYDFLREIGGDRINLSMLISPGAESHSYEPTPKDIAAVNSCDIFVYVGGKSDAWVGSLIESGDNQNMKVVTMMDCVELLDEPHQEGDDHDHQEEEESKDEHVWTSPKNAVLIVEKLTETLCEADPGNSSYYRENAQDYKEKLEELDREFTETIENSQRKTLVFGDRFPFNYFVNAYGLDYISAYPGCSTDTEVSSADIARIIDYVKENNIPVVFYLELSSGNIADTICEATGAKKLLLHSCHNVSKEDFENGVTYLQLMENNLSNIKEALN